MKTILLKSLRNVALALGGGLLLGAATPSCGEVDELIDCNTVCGRYSKCFDSGYDVGACRARCEEKADQDKDFARKTDACAVCIDDRSCSEATFKCATECAGIVP
jgi:hypothetical protein